MVDTHVASFKSVVTALDAHNLIAEILIRLFLVMVYFCYKLVTPSPLSVSRPEEYLAYAYPVTLDPIVTKAGLYFTVMYYSAATVIIGSLYARLHLRASFTGMINLVVYYSLAVSLSLLVTAATTNVTKCFAGRLRPDFIHRCLPNIFDVDHIPHIRIFDANGVPFPEFSKPVLDCDPMSPFSVLDGIKSFPSGHSSYTASIGATAAVFFYRLGRKAPPNRSAVHGITVVLCILFCLVVPLYVGISRVQDHRHHPSDVVAGLSLGALCGLLSGYLYFSLPHAIPASEKYDYYTQELTPIKTLTQRPGPIPI